MRRTAADYIAQALAQAGVKRIYGVVGDSRCHLRQPSTRREFAVSMPKAVLDGRAKELIDLATVNLTP